MQKGGGTNSFFTFSCWKHQNSYLMRLIKEPCLPYLITMEDRLLPWPGSYFEHNKKTTHVLQRDLACSKSLKHGKWQMPHLKVLSHWHRSGRWRHNLTWDNKMSWTCPGSLHWQRSAPPTQTLSLHSHLHVQHPKHGTAKKPSLCIMTSMDTGNKPMNSSAWDWGGGGRRATVSVIWKQSGNNPLK